MKDRLIPQEYNLENGLKILYFKSDDPFVVLRYYIPFGSGHNNDEIKNGTFHFLEHLVCNRSIVNPTKRSFAKKIGLVGGYFNAYTGYRSTIYEAQLPNTKYNLISDYYSQIFEPIVEDTDVKEEAPIIKNERKAKERWYPGQSEISNYIWTEWMHQDRDYLSQIFGTDQDMDSYNSEYFNNLHKKYYFSNKGILFVGGDIDPTILVDQFSKVATHEVEKKILKRYFKWNNKKYTEKEFDDANRYEYRVGLIYDKDIKKDLHMKFLGGLLINSTHGPLFEWLREEKGFVYNIKRDYGNTFENSFSSILFPFSEYNQVAESRKELVQRARNSILDKNLIEKEKARLNGADCFDYQTIDDIINASISYYQKYGIYISEQMINNIFDNVTSEDLLQILEGEEFGELLIKPIKK